MNNHNNHSNSRGKFHHKSDRQKSDFSRTTRTNITNRTADGADRADRADKNYNKYSEDQYDTPINYQTDDDGYIKCSSKPVHMDPNDIDHDALEMQNYAQNSSKQHVHQKSEHRNHGNSGNRHNDNIGNSINNDNRRYRSDFKTEIKIVTQEKTITSGASKDISLNGIFVFCKEKLPEGTPCTIELFMNCKQDDRGIFLDGHITRVTSEGLGLAFDNMDVDTYEHLRKIVLYNARNPEDFLEQCEKRPGFK